MPLSDALRHLRATVLAALLALTAPGAGAADITVFAAASLKTALDDITRDWTAQTGHRARISYAGSSALTRQIQQGAPADVFVSANTDWMDLLQNEGWLVPSSRRDLLRNTLVLVAPVGSTLPAVDDLGALDLLAALGDGRLAMALVDAVPAGIYGKAALQSLGQWARVAPRVAQTDNVRAALALVALGAAPLGVVYATDAQADPRVRVVAAFAPDSHPPIVYPAAAIATGDTALALAFLDYLGAAPTKAAFLRHGFRPAGG